MTIFIRSVSLSLWGTGGGGGGGGGGMEEKERKKLPPPPFFFLFFLVGISLYISVYFLWLY